MDADQIDYSCEDILPDGKLPGDVMVSILSNLPVKSLLKFKSVCKSWRSLISSPVFIKMHLHRQSVIANNLIISLDAIEYYVTQLALYSHNYELSKIVLPWSSVEEGGVDVLDSCNGLVCMGNCKFGIPNPGKDIILWNPATRRYRFLKCPKKPSCPYFLIKGLSFVEATNDYKIVGLAFRQTPVSEQYLFVYNLSSDSWKELDYNFNNFPIYPVPPTFFNGCIHWLADKCPCYSECTCSSVVNVIFVFDVVDEVMRYFGVPDNYNRRSKLSRQILVIKGCLSVVTFPQFQYEVMENGIEIWAMLEYGVEGSWVKQFTIQGLTAVAIPLRSWKDSEILFIYYKSKEEVSLKMMFYEPSSEKKIFFELGFFLAVVSCQVFNYVESLVPVD